MNRFNEFFEHVVKRIKEIIRQHGEEKILPLFFFGYDDKKEIFVVTVPLDENKSIFEYFPSAISIGVSNADWMVFTAVGNLRRKDGGAMKNVLIVSGFHFNTRKFVSKMFKVVKLEEDYEFDNVDDHPFLMDFREDFEEFVRKTFEFVKREVVKGENL